MAGKKYYHTDEVAELLGCSISEVYELLNNGTLQGHKNRRWQINKDQPYLNKAANRTVRKKTVPVAPVWKEKSAVVATPQTKYVKDSEHEEVIYKSMLSARKSLSIASADLKYFNICGRPLLAVLEEVAKKGVKIRIICSNPKDKVIDNLSAYKTLYNTSNFYYMVCQRNHMKMYIFDEKKVYVGSANLTNAAIGERSDKHRNFEAGILTNDPVLVKNAVEHFDSIWNQKVCVDCGKKDCEYY